MLERPQFIEFLTPLLGPSHCIRVYRHDNFKYNYKCTKIRSVNSKSEEIDNSSCEICHSILIFEGKLGQGAHFYSTPSIGTFVAKTLNPLDKKIEVEEIIDAQ